MNSGLRRYLVITQLFLPTKGGTAVWFDEVYRRLGGKEIHIITADVPGAAEYDAGHPNSVHRVSLKRYAWLRPESLALYAKLIANALTVTLRHPVDAVHAGRVLPEGLAGWIVARIIRRPLIVYAHGEEITAWRAPGKRKGMKFVFRHAQQVIANSDFTRERLLELGVDPSRIVLISPGVDVIRFCPGDDGRVLREKLGLHAGQSLILSVGRLSRRKGFDQVIRALPALMARGLDVHYAVIGIGEDEAYLRALAAELSVAGRVHFLAHQSMDDLPRWYRAADVFAMPNREIDGDTEGFGMVFLEAAATGKPALAGLAGGTGAAVVDGHTGLRVDGVSVDCVAEGLWRLLGDQAYAAQLGRNGLDRVRAQCAWEVVADNTRALTVVGGGRR